jgi:phosphoadenosine phosphosulfate reductase
MSAYLSDLISLLTRIAQQHPSAVLATSLSAEDMLLTHVIAKESLPITLITLDTGMLHGETLSLLETIKQTYGINVQRFTPNETAVSAYISELGKFGFYESLEARKRCCAIRKVEPLQRALKGRTAWITGQRRDQAATRGELAVESFDKSNGIVKFNPLAEWTSETVWQFVRANDVPYNVLHDRGYPSIGCEPCTRAVRPGEDERAGRWWWESRDSKECGLHAINFQKKEPQAEASASV